MSKHAFLALAAMGALIGVLLLTLLVVQPEAHESAVGVMEVARDSDHVAQEEGVSVGAHPRTELSGEVRVEVIDAETKVGIRRASALKIRDDGSRIATDVLGKWSSLDGLGVVIPLAELGSGSWRFRADGYEDQVFGEDPPTLVELRPCGRIIVRLKTVEEQPAAGVPVMAYRQQVPSEHLQHFKYEDAVPGCDASSAIYAGVTNSEGVAMIGGMPTGSFGLCLGGLDHALVDLDNEVVEVRRHDVNVEGHVTFIAAYVGKCGQGRLLDMRYSAPLGAGDAGDFTPEAIRARRWLERRFPGACAVTICKPRPCESYAAEDMDEVAVTAEGWKTWSAKVRMKRPSLVELQDVAGGERVDYGRLQVDIQTPSGARPVGIDLSVALVSQNDNSLFKGVPMMSGVEFPLPPGEYNVTTWTPLLRFGPLSATVKSHESTRISVLCEREVRGLRLAIHAGGAVPRFAQIGLSGVGWRGMKFGAYDPRAVHCAGIVGPATLSVHVYGHEPFEREVIIQAGTEIQDIEVRLP